MVKLVNRAKMTVASGGAGTLTLGTAPTGYQTFTAAGVSTGDYIRYTIEDGESWEVGLGFYNSAGPTLARNTVHESSNSGNAITCSADAVIFVTIAAEDFTDNAAPSFTNTISDTLELAAGVTSTINAKALDDDGFPITYSFDAFSGNTVYSASSLPPQFTSITANQTTGVFSLAATSSVSGAGSVNLRVRASDGVRTATKKVLCNLSFFPTSGLKALYDMKNSSSYSGTGTTWYDISGNSGPNLTINTSVATYNASGIGGIPQLSVLAGSNNSAFYSGNHFPTYDTSTYKSTVAVIYANDVYPQQQFKFFSNGTAGSASVTSYNSTSTPAVYRGTGFGQVPAASATSTLYIDKVNDPNLTEKGFMDAVGLAPNYQKYHSVVLTDGYYVNGFTWNANVNMTAMGHIRAIAFWDRALTQAEVTGLHAHFAGDYTSSEMVQ